MKKTNNQIFRIAAVVLSLLAVSCVNEIEGTFIELNKGTTLTFTAVQAGEGPSSKTVRNGDGTLSWSPADEINVFCGTMTFGRFVSDNEEPVYCTTFTGHFDEDIPEESENTFYAVYPYSPANTFDGNAVALSVPSVQVSGAGSFGVGMYPSVAKSTDTSLAFHNVCGGIKFSVSRSDITDITIVSKGGEPLSGKVKVSFGSDGIPEVSVTEGISEITIRPSDGGCFRPGEYYYMAVLPVTMDEGFTMTFNTDNGKQGTLESFKSVTIRRSIFSRKDNIDSAILDWTDNEDNPDYSDSGIYLGILGFNQALYTYPVTLLTQESVKQAKSFIDGLQMKNGTILYYAADNGLANMQAAGYPWNLASASLVTFTDGLDQGSLMMNWDYDTDEKYLSAVNTRIRNGNVAGLPLSAYSIGIKGSDVTNVTKFKDNITRLSSSDENAYEISNMKELNSKFESIASVASVAVEYTHDVTLTIPGLPDGTKVRFTFDNVNSADQSQIYIEGTFNLRYRSLTSVTYHGLTSTSGASVAGTVDDVFVSFVFSKVRRGDRKELSRDYLKQWQCEDGSTKWQVNSEFDKAAGTDIDVKFVQKSAAVYLVLDCSNSLDSQFGTMKTYAKNFIQKLYDNSYIERSVKSVRISADEMTLNKGERRSLSAVVYPVTAEDRSVTWSSGNGNVATVDASGNVTGIGAGTTDIFVRANDGGYSDYCTIKVNDSISDPQGQGNFSQSGLYLGVLAFNQGLYRYPICRLTEETASSINDFIDGVAQRNGSVLCCAVDDAVTGIQTPKYPSDLSNAALITFTDGLDQGSLMKNNSYTTNGAYLSYVNDRIRNAKAGQVPVTAYSIGIRDNDVTDIDKYRSDLAKLASSESNAYEITDIYALKSKLNTIADVVKVSVSYEYTYSISLTIPGASNGTRIRFTFDNVLDASKSNLYLEGTFNLSNRSLSDINYVGITSSSGNSVNGHVDGIFVTFDFNGVKKNGGESLSWSYTKQWSRSSTEAEWQINSEFDAGSDVHTESKTEINRKSGAVYLVLDCSSSIGSRISTVKSSAKDFVNALQKESYDQYAVSSVSLNSSQQAICIGDSIHLMATVRPSTASDKSVTWSSSNPDVATVSEEGVVSGRGIGKTIIKAVSTDGGYSAECMVYVAEIHLSDTEVRVVKGNTHQLSATFRPDDFPDQTLIWTSSNTSVASVSSSGLVTAKSSGTCKITAKCRNTTVTAECEVSVFIPVSGVTLNMSQTIANIGNRDYLGAQVIPSTASDKSVTWNSSNPSVVSVSQNGFLSALSEGMATVTVYTNDGGYSAVCDIWVIDYSKPIDLGMPSGIKWSACNLGASDPEDYACHYQWAGCERVDDIGLEWSNCPYHGRGYVLSYSWWKYVPSGMSSYWTGSGRPDNKTVLDPEDDVAHTNLGGKWRMPTKEEWSELANTSNCSWTWTSFNSLDSPFHEMIYGYKVQSKKTGFANNWIFLPAAGYRYSYITDKVGSCGRYWSSSLNTSTPSCAYCLRFDSDDINTDSSARYYGLSVRPVSE